MTQSHWMNSPRLAVSSPCDEDWNAMEVSGQKRFCGQCMEHVHDLSTMTRAEALKLISREKAPCVRFSCDRDGKVRYKEEPKEPARRPVRKGLVLRTARLAAVLGLSLIGGRVHAEEGDVTSDVGETMVEAKGWIVDRALELFQIVNPVEVTPIVVDASPPELETRGLENPETVVESNVQSEQEKPLVHVPEPEVLERPFLMGRVAMRSDD